MVETDKRKLYSVTKNIVGLHYKLIASKRGGDPSADSPDGNVQSVGNESLTIIISSESCFVYTVDRTPCQYITMPLINTRNNQINYRMCTITFITALTFHNDDCRHEIGQAVPRMSFHLQTWL